MRRQDNAKTNAGGATALLLAAGAGCRLAVEQPKAYTLMCGRPMIAWSLEAFEASPSIDRVVVAVPDGYGEDTLALAKEHCPTKEIDVVNGGNSRSLSTSLALERAGQCRYVAVHDAARPMVGPELIEGLIAEIERLGCDCVVPATSVYDTIKRCDRGGTVIETLKRDGLKAVQTPQVFRSKSLQRAVSNAAPSELEHAPDDAALVEAIGGDVRVLDSTLKNIKITTADDLEHVQFLLSERSTAR